MVASIRIGADERLSQCPEVAVNNNMPSPLSERLDQLVAVADEQGAGTSRKELLASLVLAAPEDGEDLLRRVIAYRRAAAADAALRSRESGSVLEFRRHPRGPRRRVRQA
jgi:hypothetical protein